MIWALVAAGIFLVMRQPGEAARSDAPAPAANDQGFQLGAIPSAGGSAVPAGVTLQKKIGAPVARLVKPVTRPQPKGPNIDGLTGLHRHAAPQTSHSADAPIGLPHNGATPTELRRG